MCKPVAISVPTAAELAAFAAFYRTTRDVRFCTWAQLVFRPTEPQLSAPVI